MHPPLPSAVPEIPVADIVAATSYYRDRLGFDVDWLDTEIMLAGISRDRCRIFLAGPVFRENRNGVGPTVTWLNLESAGAVDALYDAWQASGATLLSSPELKPWGLHEFTACDPDGNRLRVFHDVSTPERERAANPARVGSAEPAETHRMTPTIAIHRLSPDDITLARDTFALVARVFEEPSDGLSDSYVAALLARPSLWALAALHDGVPVGGVIAHALPMTRTETTELFIYDIAVDPTYQRQGIGRALVGTLRALAAAQQITVAFVPADDDDAHALDFYRALGGDPAPVTIFTFES